MRPVRDRQAPLPYEHTERYRSVTAAKGAAAELATADRRPRFIMLLLSEWFHVALEQERTLAVPGAKFVMAVPPPAQESAP